jgi:hypothetical protein
MLLTQVLVFINDPLNIISALRKFINHVGDIFGLLYLDHRMLLVVVVVPG